MSGSTGSPDGARATARGIALPFREAISFFRQKTNLPTQSYLDVWAEAHTRSFMVAGAATSALVQDFRDEVTKALEQGTTLAEFRAAFDALVIKHGWEHTGTPGWRARIIFETNLSTAYSAGRYAQATEPDTLAVYPYWQYVHSGARHPRLQHLSWNGKVLLASDPWWSAHYPPNGWRCGCRVEVLSARGLRRMGRDGPDPSPPVMTRPWTNPRTGETREVPIGIDPGFDYNPGQAWQGGRRPEIPADAVLRPPATNWPPLPPAPTPKPARHAASGPDTDVVTVAEGTGPRDFAIPPPNAEEAARLARLKMELLARLRGMGAPVAADEGAASVQQLRDRVVDFPRRQRSRAELRRLGIPDPGDEEIVPLKTLENRIRYRDVRGGWG
jgi:hypothetical protein